MLFWMGMSILASLYFYGETLERLKLHANENFSNARNPIDTTKKDKKE